MTVQYRHARSTVTVQYRHARSTMTVQYRHARSTLTVQQSHTRISIFLGGGIKIILALCVFLFTLQKYRDGPGTPMGSATLPTQRLVFCVPNHGKTTKANGLNFEDNFILAITLKLVQMFQFCFHC